MISIKKQMRSCKTPARVSNASMGGRIIDGNPSHNNF